MNIYWTLHFHTQVAFSNVFHVTFEDVYDQYIPTSGSFSYLLKTWPHLHVNVYALVPSLDSVTKTSTPSYSKNGKTAGQQGAPWETLVVFAINLKQLTVQMNMSNVMGNNT